MGIALLIVGYLLAVPPLLFIRRIWRERIWLGYVAELVGAGCITAGWIVQGSISAVAINAAWVVVFGIGFPLRAGPARG